MHSFTIIVDSNISHLDSYFNADILGINVEDNVNVIAMAGRDITSAVLAKHSPQALLVRSVTQVNEGLLAENKSVTYVGSATIGTDHIDQDYLKLRNISFTNAAGCSKHSVAQYVITSILTLHPDYWKKPIKLGVIGLGNIGQTLAKYAHTLGWQVLGYDPLIPTSDVNNTALDKLLAQSDVISLHVPLTTDHQSFYPTYHLINKASFDLMKTDTLLINAARGNVINEVALLDDISNTNRLVVLDVFEHEPIVSGHLLAKLAVATPHIAGYSVEGKLRGTQMVYMGLCEHFNLPINQSIDSLLSDNPFHWQMLQKDHAKLTDFYDLMQDDAKLRIQLNPLTGLVSAADFDQLRKNYPLRREWLFD